MGEKVAKNCAWWVGLGQVTFMQVKTWADGGLAGPGEVGGWWQWGCLRPLQGRLCALSMELCRGSGDTGPTPPPQS